MLRRLVTYAGHMFGANAITGLLTFGVSTFGMATRPKEAFGDYARYVLIYAIALGVIVGGANATVQRFAADDPDNRMRFASLAFTIFFVLLVVSGVAGAAVGIFLDWNYALSLFGLPWIVLHWHSRYIVRSNLDARREARLMMIASLSNSILQALFLTLTDLRDALIYGDFIALVISGAAGMLVLSSALGLSIPAIARTPVPAGLVRDWARFAAPLWLAGQVALARAQIQGLWTSARLGAAPMGAYQAMQTMWQFAHKPMEYLSQASLPGLVSARENRQALYRELLRLCLVAFTAIGLVVAAGIPAIFRTIDAVRVVLGKTDGIPMMTKYSEVPELLLIVALAMPLTAFEVVTNQFVVAHGKQRLVLFAHAANAVVIAAAILPLTARYGLTGVVIAGVVGEVGMAAVFLATMSRGLGEEARLAFRWLLVTTVSCGVALVPVYAYREWVWGWTLAAPAGLIFLGGMLMTGVLGRGDFRRALSFRRPAGEAR